MMLYTIKQNVCYGFLFTPWIIELALRQADIVSQAIYVS